MTPEIQHLLSRFRPGAPRVQELGFCKGNRPAAVKQWAESLPALRIGYTSAVFYKAVPAVTSLAVAPEIRLEMLEALRPSVQNCIQGLAKQFLNQPLSLPESPLKSAVVAQALQKHMTAGYTGVLQELLSNGNRNPAADKLALACHRAITGYGLMLLRSYQLYSRVPAKLWLDLHSVYRVAEGCRLLDKVVADPLLKAASGSTPAQAYHRILLLACSRPNQIRQQDLAAVYDALEQWSYRITLEEPGERNADCPFLVNLATDMAPVYKSRFAAGEHNLIRTLNIDPLLSAFRRERQRQDSGGIPIPAGISVALADHLEQSWGGSRPRSFERRAGEAPLEICVGLSALHHHSIGGIPLEEFTGSEGMEEINLGATAGDPWSQPLDKGSGDFPTFTVAVVNNSPGGYCLEWRGAVPQPVKAGEVLGLRERGRHRWSLGVIRWLQQQDEGTRMGVQLLSPKVTAYAAAVEQANGEFSDYRRVLMLPELKAANQPATLLTPFAPFQENHRLLLNQRGDSSLVQLARRLFSTGSVSQFAFRALLSESEAAAEGQNEEFASDWKD